MPKLRELKELNISARNWTLTFSDRRVFLKIPKSKCYRKVMLMIVCVQVIHISLLLTYDHWAGALFGNRGI